MRLTVRSIVITATLLLPSAAVAGKASTTRIETRPFYGATVTLEEGVRVFRPLPYHDRVIINPGGRTPLSLNIEDHRHYGHPSSQAPHVYDDRDHPGAPYYGAPLSGAPHAHRGPRTAAKRYVPTGRDRGPPAHVKPAPVKVAPPAPPKPGH